MPFLSAWPSGIHKKYFPSPQAFMHEAFVDSLAARGDGQGRNWMRRKIYRGGGGWMVNLCVYTKCQQMLQKSCFTGFPQRELFKRPGSGFPNLIWFYGPRSFYLFYLSSQLSLSTLRSPTIFVQIFGVSTLVTIYDYSCYILSNYMTSLRNSTIASVTSCAVSYAFPDKVSVIWWTSKHC